MPESIVNGLFALVVAAIGGLLGYGAAISAAVRKEQNAAALDFQGIFHRTLFKVDPRYRIESKKVDVCEILESDFECHAIAVMKFRQYVPKEKTADFDAVWTNYHAYEVTDGHYWYAYFDKYRLHTGDPRYNIDTDSIIKNIHQILTFAKLNHKSPFDPIETESR